MRSSRSRDVAADLVVALDRLVDLRPPDLDERVEPGEVDGEPGERGEPLEQRTRAERVRRRGDVVRYRRPQRRRLPARPTGRCRAARRRCPSGPRSATAREPELTDERRVGRGAGDAHRACVRDVAEERAQRDHHVALRRRPRPRAPTRSTTSSARSARRRARRRGRARGTAPRSTRWRATSPTRRCRRPCAASGGATGSRRAPRSRSTRSASTLRTADEPVGGAAGGVAGVVPAFEGGDEQRVAQARPFLPHQSARHHLSLRIGVLR